MFEPFYDFRASALGVAQLLFIIGIGVVLYVRRLVNKEGCVTLNNILVWVCLPVLMFVRITLTFEPEASPIWWLLPFCAIAMALLGMGTGFLLSTTLKDCTFIREFILASGFANCGYLPMALVTFVCPGETSSIMLVYIFLFIIGFNLTIWSFAPAFLKKDFSDNIRISNFLTPPAISTILSVVFVFLWGNDFLPSAVYAPLRLIGDASFPLALILLGANLAQYQGYRLHKPLATITCIMAKLIILPLLVLIIIINIPLDSLYKFIIFLQSTMPSAVSLIVIGAYSNADNRFISNIIFYSHVGSILTVPSWLIIFNLVNV